MNEINKVNYKIPYGLTNRLKEKMEYIKANLARGDLKEVLQMYYNIQTHINQEIVKVESELKGDTKE